MPVVTRDHADKLYGEYREQIERRARFVVECRAPEYDGNWFVVALFMGMSDARAYIDTLEADEGDSYEYKLTKLMR